MGRPLNAELYRNLLTLLRRNITWINLPIKRKFLPDAARRIENDAIFSGVVGS